MRIIPDIRAKRDSESKFDVTRFKVLTCRLPDKQYQVVTLDGQTGYPIPHAKVTMYSNDEKVLQEFTTNEEGKGRISLETEYRYLKASRGRIRQCRNKAFMQEVTDITATKIK